MPRKSFAHILWIIIVFSFGIGISYIALQGVSYAYSNIFDKKENPNDQSSQVQIFKNINLNILPGNKKYLTIGFVGDIAPGIDPFDNIFTDVHQYTTKPDIMIANLEGTVTENVYSKCKTESKNCFAFNGDQKFLKLLSNASFHVLNVANNHFNDYGDIGQEETLRQIGVHGMIPTGMKNTVTYLKKEGINTAIIGVSNYAWGNSMESTKTLHKIISEADQNADIVVVVFHGGGEGEKYSHTPVGTEWYLNENRGDLRAFAHAAIDSGADIVVGSGPHVLRGIEKYNNKLIAYSLGNFASANSTSTQGILKVSALLEVNIENNGTFISGKINPLEIDTYGIPHPDEKGIAISNINNLSQEDFGQNGVKLDNYGEIIWQ